MIKEQLIHAIKEALEEIKALLCLNYRTSHMQPYALLINIF